MLIPDFDFKKCPKCGKLSAYDPRFNTDFCYTTKCTYIGPGLSSWDIPKNVKKMEEHDVC